MLVDQTPTHADDLRRAAPAKRELTREEVAKNKRALGRAVRQKKQQGRVLLLLGFLPPAAALLALVALPTPQGFWLVLWPAAGILLAVPLFWLSYQATQASRQIRGGACTRCYIAGAWLQVSEEVVNWERTSLPRPAKKGRTSGARPWVPQGRDAGTATLYQIRQSWRCKYCGHLRETYFSRLEEN